MHIQNFTSSMTECTVIFTPLYVCNDINILRFSDFVYGPGLSSTDLIQCSKYFKNWFSHENRVWSIDENGALNGFNLRNDVVVLLTFMISKKLSNIKQNSAVPAASAGP